ncbi:Unknown protein sequence [Pseudomonas syringae pv. syringae]|nr:Unknown protein sequence [Pseudomonas syringae pv. syringae]
MCGHGHTVWNLSLLTEVSSCGVSITYPRAVDEKGVHEDLPVVLHRLSNLDWHVSGHCQLG